MVANINIDWPGVFTAPLSAIAWLFASSSSATGLDCLLAGNTTRLPLAMQKVLFGLLMPAALLMILLGIDLIRVRMRARPGPRGSGWRLPMVTRHSARPQGGILARTAIVLVFFFLPSLLRTAYGMFACVYLDSPPSTALQTRQTFFRFDAVGRYWLLDTDQHCFERLHRGWALGLGIPLLLLLCGAGPLGIIGFLWLRRNNLQETYYLQHFGFLYSSYRPCRYYWEGIVALQVSQVPASHRQCCCASHYMVIAVCSTSNMCIAYI